MTGHWPKGWARRGDGHTVVSSDPKKAIGLEGRAWIEGRHYDRYAEYSPMEAPAEFRQQMQIFADEGYHTVGGIKAVADPEVMRSLLDEGGEWLALSTHTEGYPSGGSVEYASYAYFDGHELRTGGDSSVKWQRARFFRIIRNT